MVKFIILVGWINQCLGFVLMTRYMMILLMVMMDIHMNLEIRYLLQLHGLGCSQISEGGRIEPLQLRSSLPT